MTRTVVFLGAGASKGLGLPLTSEIFPALLDRLDSERSNAEELFGGDRDDQGALRECLHAIIPGLSEVVVKSGPRHEWYGKLPLITELLSTIDYLLLSAATPSRDLTPSKLVRGRKLLERGIFELLVRFSPHALEMEGIPPSVVKEWEETGKLKLLPPRSPDHEIEVQRTVDWIVRLAGNRNDHVSIVSTNYDIEIEQGLYRHLGYDRVFTEVDFGVSVRSPADDRDKIHHRPTNGTFDVYKLHGSLNWLRCDLCDNIYVNPVGAIAYLSFLLGDDTARYAQKYPWLEQLGRSGANECHCGYRPLRHMIVAPSFVRDVRDPILLEIWRNALEAMREADKWIVIGYSLPSEDVAIRSLLLRAYQGRGGAASDLQIEVVQKDKTGPEEMRYQLLFPNRLTYVAGGLASYLDGRDAI